MIEILKCKKCGTIMVFNKLYCIKECSTCGSVDIEIFTVDENEEIM